jgi:hypothetical protein
MRYKRIVQSSHWVLKFPARNMTVVVTATFTLAFGAQRFSVAVGDPTFRKLKELVCDADRDGLNTTFQQTLLVFNL